MHAIEFDAVTHNGLLTIPETYRPEWNEKSVRVILMEVEDKPAPGTRPLLSALQNIKINGPEDFSKNLDDYLNGEKNA